MSKTSKMKKAALWLITVALAAVCFTLTPQNVEAAPKKKITLEKTKITMYGGEKIKLKVKSVTGLKSKKVTFSSKDTAVSPDGTIDFTGVTKWKGTFTVTATSVEDPSVKATCKVTVKLRDHYPVIELNKDEIRIKKGQKVTLKVKNVISLSSKEVKYEIGDKSIATVNSNGVVKWKKPGITWVRATSKTNSDCFASISVYALGTPTHIDVPKNITLQTGYGTKLNFVTVQPNAFVTNDKFTVTSSNPEVALVTNDGGEYGVLAASEGKATLTVKAKANKKITAKIKVTVKKKVQMIKEFGRDKYRQYFSYSPYYPEADFFCPSDVALVPLGDFLKTNPAKLKKTNLFWVSCNPEELTVDQNGNVTLAKGKTYGSAYINVYTTDGSGLSYKIMVAINTEK